MILNIYPVFCLQHVLILLIVQQQLLLHVKLTQLLIMIFQQPCWSHSGTPLAYNFTFQLFAAIQDLSGAQHLFCRKFLRNYLSSQTVLHFIYVWVATVFVRLMKIYKILTSSLSCSFLNYLMKISKNQGIIYKKFERTIIIKQYTHFHCNDTDEI